MASLFSESALTLVKPDDYLVPKCGQCKLHEGCQSPFMKPDGKGRKRFFILGEAPGLNEDRQGKPFVGDSGQLLEECLSNVGIDLRRDCWIHNACACHPKNNATPTDKQIAYCRPLVSRALRELRPDVVIPLGSVALQSLLKLVYCGGKHSIMKWAGWRIPYKDFWIAPTYHPSFVLHEERNPVVRMYFEKHLAAAAKLTGKPWKKFPNYQSKVQCIYKDSEAADLIDGFTERGNWITYDYETNMKKPDSDRARIVCCSISDGETTIAFPWLKKSKRALSRLLLSKVPKGGQNIQFEQRWTSKFLGHEVKNWWYDCMVGQHWLDNREGICALDFQAFVYLGIPPWDQIVTPYLRTEGGGNTPNKVDQLDMRDLLNYCALDALIEWKLIERHCKVSGKPLPGE